MVKLKNIFQRKEKKYLLTMENYRLLQAALAPYMCEDEYGLHTIISVYYDTCDYQMIQASIEKPKYKEKFRLRSYGVPTAEQKVFLEIKKKVKGVVYKRRVALPYAEAQAYHRAPDCRCMTEPKDRQIAAEIDWLINRKKLAPKVMIAYDRRAFHMRCHDDNDFRITFDFNIRYRTDHLDISAGSEGRLVAPEIDVLMEVKALGAYPVWFSEILSALTIYKGSFSKYAQTYLRHIIKEEYQDVV